MGFWLFGQMEHLLWIPLARQSEPVLWISLLLMSYNTTIFHFNYSVCLVRKVIIMCNNKQ